MDSVGRQIDGLRCAPTKKFHQGLGNIPASNNKEKENNKKGKGKEICESTILAF